MIKNCVIIDDEPLAIKVIQNHLRQVKNLNLIHTFGNAIDGLSFIEENKVDVIFLDINMPLLDGFNFIKSLVKKPLIIVTTAHSEYAVESYELDVLDYLIKPISFPRFITAINKFHRAINYEINPADERSYIFVKTDLRKMQKIFLDEILAIESLKDYLKIITLSGKFVILKTLSTFTEELPSKNFVRIHRSYTIAIDKIDTIQGNTVKIDSAKYVIGRTYSDAFKERIAKHINKTN